MKTVKIYQTYYNESSKSKLSKHFKPYNNTNPLRPNEYEFGVMKDLYYACNWSNTSHLGVLSWKFEYKTRIKAQTLIDFIKMKDIADILIVNPFLPGGPNPDQINGYKNVWDQGDYWHPGLKILTNKLFDYAKINTELLEIETSTSAECYSNYWIANKNFWDLYMSYAIRLYNAIYSNKELENEVFSKRTSSGLPVCNSNHNYSYFPFIFERIFSTLLSIYESSFSIQQIRPSKFI